MPPTANPESKGASPQQLPFLSNIGFVLTYRCTTACPHCVVEAGPNRKETMPLSVRHDWLRQAARYQGGLIKGLALTGGEPFYDLDGLSQTAALGAELGFVVTAVTNAFWATSLEAARATLIRVPAIRMLSLSTDAYHQRAIPFANIRNAIAAARELGRLYNIAVCTEAEDDPRYLSIVAELSALGEADRIAPSVVYPVGRAARTGTASKPTLPEPTRAACTMAGLPVVLPDGRVVACIGPALTLPPPHPLALGDLSREPLAEILDRSELNVVLQVIRVWGPHRLVDLLRQHSHEDLIPQTFIRNCVCDPCYRLLSNPKALAALDKICADETLKQTTAYGRVYYLNETTMAQRLGLNRPSARSTKPSRRRSRTSSSPRP